MTPSSRGVLRFCGYLTVAVLVAVIGPAVFRGARRTGRWASDAGRDAGSPLVNLLADVLGTADSHHHGDRGDLFDDLIRSTLGRGR